MPPAIAEKLINAGLIEVGPSRQPEDHRKRPNRSFQAWIIKLKRAIRLRRPTRTEETQVSLRTSPPSLSTDRSAALTRKGPLVIYAKVPTSPRSVT